jgi:glucose/arabinose dehydrogenase
MESRSYFCLGGRLWMLVVLACLGCVLPANAQRKQPERSIPNLYSNLCSACHGVTMGGAQTKGFLNDQWNVGNDDAAIANSIRVGNTNKGMAAFGGVLSDAEIRAMVVYIRETIQKAKNQTNNFAKPVDGQVVASQEHKFRLRTVAGGLSTPWSMAFLPDGRMLVAERTGALRVIEGGKLQPNAILGTPPVWARGQGGLLEVVLHPGFATNAWIYLSYSDRGSNAAGADVSMTAIVRGRIRDGNWVNEQTIFRAPMETYLPTTVHFGNRIVFDDAGYLFFSIGERGRMENAQDLTLPNGKIHRLHDNGRIPRDNPFVKTNGAMASIWCLGNRNPQGLARHPVTGELWATEHGPRGGDELNLIRPGVNYGWPVICYGMNYNGLPITEGITAQKGMEQPVIHWTPSIAVCGIEFYTGDKFPKWKNNLFVTGLASQELRRLVIEGHSVKAQEVVFKNIGRVRDVACGLDGYLYVALNTPDEIVRLELAE